MLRIHGALAASLYLALAACGGGSRADRNSGVTVAVECAPFARALSGVSLSGAAADWWRQAKDHYDRTQQPEVGSVLVFRRSGRLPNGHVAVVSQVLSRRRIMVTQANWVHHHVTVDQPVIDVSDRGDWSIVQVWWAPTGQMGTAEYATFGFIRPHQPMDHDRLKTATLAAIRIAESGR